MVRSLLFIFALPALSACGSSDAALFGAARSNDCPVGTSTACIGQEGCSGRRTCAADGTRGSCVCTAEPAGSGGDGSGGAGGSLGGVGGVSPSGSGGSGTGGSSSGGSASGGSASGGSAGLGTESGGSGGSSADASAPGSSCEARSYTGTLTGPYRASAVIMATFSARVNFDVSAKGAIEGTLKGTSDTSSEATLVGTMDCASRHVSIDITMGSYGSFPLARTYEGTMTAELDPVGHVMENGSWTITEPDNSTAGGSGTWSAR